MEGLAILALLYFLGKKQEEKPKGWAAPAAKVPKLPPGVIPSPTKPGIPPASVRMATLAKRAVTPRAQAWVPVLVRAGASAQLAAGLARWIGIESGGDPLAKSQLGERGLLQMTATSAKSAGITDKEWTALGQKSTTNEEHARIALKQFKYHVLRSLGAAGAKRPIVDQLFYGKLHHAYPQDLTVTTARPPAGDAVRVLPPLLKTENQRLRLASATIVAFGEGGGPKS